MRKVRCAIAVWIIKFVLFVVEETVVNNLTLKITKIVIKKSSVDNYYVVVEK